MVGGLLVRLWLIVSSVCVNYVYLWLLFANVFVDVCESLICCRFVVGLWFVIFVCCLIIVGELMGSGLSIWCFVLRIVGEVFVNVWLFVLVYCWCIFCKLCLFWVNG